MYAHQTLSRKDQALLRVWRYLDTHDTVDLLKEALSTVADVLQAVYVVALWSMFILAFAAVTATAA